MKELKVSIVIPVYNAEKFIKKCTNSILNQTYKNIELILVNDGSKDDSLNVLKEIAKKDKRVIVIDQKNSGAAQARNTGLKKCTGDYLVFVDIDDWLDKDYIESYVNGTENGKYDFVIGGYRQVVGKKIRKTIKLNNQPFSKYICGGPWCHLIKMDFVKKHNIYFTNVNIGEDTCFITKAFSCGAKVNCISYVGYNYYFNDKSLTNVQYKQLNDRLNIIELMNDINVTTGVDIDIHQYFMVRYMVSYLLWAGRVSSSKKMMEYTKKYFNFFNKIIPNYKNNKYVNWKCPKGEIRKNNYIVRIFVLLYKTKLLKLFTLIYCRGKNENN